MISIRNSVACIIHRDGISTIVLFGRLRALRWWDMGHLGIGQDKR